MTIYAIGDIQGCYDPFRRLLDHLSFDPDEDRLWLTGDLVNRGTGSLETLRFVRSLGKSAITVLGNHDLHLIARASGVGKASHGDTLANVLRADDCDELLDWLRGRPLAHYSARLNALLVHAGVYPRWTVQKTLDRAAEVEKVLRGEGYRKFIAKLYGDTPSRWSGTLKGNKRLRFIVNCLTRIRMVADDGSLDMAHKGPPDKGEDRLVPWYAAANRRWQGTRIVFGHWSALGLLVTPDLLGLDTGCVWGRELTAVSLGRRMRVRQVDCGCVPPVSRDGRR